MFKKLLLTLACGLLLLPNAYAGYTTPTASTSETVYYYTLQSPYVSNLYLTSQGIGVTLKGESAPNDGHHWLFQLRTDGTYNLISYDNGLCAYVDPTSAPNENDAVSLSLAEPTIGWSLVNGASSSDGYCVLSASGGTIQLNQTTSDSSLSWYHNQEIYNWPRVADDGNQYLLTQVGSASGQCAVNFNSTVDGGSFTVKKDGVAINSGDIVSFGSTISIDVSAGYSLVSIKVNDTTLPDGVSSFNINKEVTIEVTLEEKDYTTPSVHENTTNTKNRYLTSITSTGDITGNELNASMSGYTEYTLLDQTLTTTPGSTFTIRCVSPTTSDRSSDMAVTHAQVFADWNCDREFIGDFNNGVPSSANEQVSGNGEWLYIVGCEEPAGDATTGRNYVMYDYTYTFNVPATASIGTSRIRITYTNAWHDKAIDACHGHGPNVKLHQGFAIDIPVNIIVNTEEYTVTVTQPAEGGTFKLYNGETEVNSGEKVTEGTTLTVVAIPNSCYELDQVFVNGTPQSGSTIEVTEDMTVTASFRQIDPKALVVNADTQFRFDDEILGSHTNGSSSGDSRSRELTYSVWVKPTTATGYVMGHGQGTIYTSAWGSFDIKYSDGNLIAYVRQAPTSNLEGFSDLTMTNVDGADMSLPVGEWAFITVTADANSVKLYKNGILISEGALSENNRIGLLHDNPCVFYVGKQDFAGYVDGAQVWTKALSQDEIRSSMRTVDTDDANLVAYYLISGTEGETITTVANQGNFETTAFLCNGTNSTAIAATVVAPHTFPTVEVTVAKEGDGEIEILLNNTELSGNTVDLFSELTITATPGEDNRLNTLTVNGVNFKSGDSYLLEGDATIAASFVSAYSTVTVEANGATYTLKNSQGNWILGINPDNIEESSDSNVTNVLYNETCTLVVHYAAEGQTVTSVTWGNETLTPAAGDFTVSSVYTFPVTASGTLTINTKPVSYCKPYEGDALTYQNNYIKTLALDATDASWHGFTLNLHPSTEHSAYLDYTKLDNGLTGDDAGYLSLPANTGSTVNIALTLNGNNVNRGYLYVDWNKDGVFNTSNELVSTSDENLTTTMPSFTVPTDLVSGQYCARFKVDYDNEDPCTLNDVAFNVDFGTLAVDFMITLTNTKSDLPTAIEEVENAVELYYANGNIYTNVEGEIQVYDLSGKLVRRAQYAPVAVDDLAGGIYIVRVNGNTLKFVK